MFRNYVYNIYNKNFIVFPLTEADKKILERLNEECENYFVDCQYDKECYKVYVLSGNQSKILFNLDEKLIFLKEFNSALNQINGNRAKVLMKWREITEKYLVLIDEKSGLYRVKEVEDCFVVITDFYESYGQMYKVHVALESLLVYLLSFEKSVIFHSSCAGLMQEHCNLFIGQSGMGKSTIAKMLESKGGCIVDDEKNIVVPKGDDRYYVYSGQARAIKRKFDYKHLEYGKLDNIYFLHQSNCNCKRKLNWSANLYEEALKANAQIGGFRQGHPLINRMLVKECITNLLQSVPVYDLFFNLSIDVESML